MKKARKILTLALCAVLLVTATVAGTLAYLTDTKTVKNTFSVGKVAITLDETDVKLDGTKDTDTRVTENDYKLMPGHSYIKDPIVHVDQNSENCYLFVKVVNEIADIEADIEADTKIADQMAAKGWTKVDGTTNIYAYKTTVNANDNITVFENFTVKSDIDGTTLAAYQGKTITVTAYAIQKDGFDNAKAAWDAAKLA